MLLKGGLILLPFANKAEAYTQSTGKEKMLGFPSPHTTINTENLSDLENHGRFLPTSKQERSLFYSRHQLVSFPPICSDCVFGDRVRWLRLRTQSASLLPWLLASLPNESEQQALHRGSHNLPSDFINVLEQLTECRKNVFWFILEEITKGMDGEMHRARCVGGHGAAMPSLASASRDLHILNYLETLPVMLFWVLWRPHCTGMIAN